MLAVGHPIANDVLSASFANFSEQERATLLDLLRPVMSEELSEPTASG